MKTDIILAGVGGQGILSIATCIGMAAMKENLFLKQSEVHGMSQRGGAVQSHFRLSDKPIASDLIPMGKADIILSVEPMEALRYLPWLNENGMVVTNSTTFVNISDYPPAEELYSKIKSLKNHVLINADEIAKSINSARSMNMVMLGASSEYLQLKFEDLEDAVKTFFAAKGENIVTTNLNALRMGREYAEKYLK